VAIPVARNANKATVAPMVGSAFGGSLESSGRFLLVHLARIWPQSPKMISHLIYFIQKFYKFCTLNEICKDNDAINCFSVQHKRGSFQ
jgi:hypothetical protein